MKLALLVFILLSLCSFTVPAQNSDQFQDEQGKSKPNGAVSEQLELSQAKASPKPLVRLLQSGKRRHPQFHIRNDYAGPVEVEVDFADRDNIQATPDLPRRFVVGPGQSNVLFQVSAIDEHESLQQTLRYRYVIGPPLTDYKATTSYLPPIGPNTLVQISQAFNGAFSHHDAQNQYAVDLSVPIGTPIYAAKSGIVLESEDNFYKSDPYEAYTAQANNIRILHDDGAMTIYAHLELKKNQVYPGLAVRAGQLIGYSGNTGFTTGPHLHFAVQVNDGMELVSVPFTFYTPQGQAEEPEADEWLQGISPNQMGGIVK
jgi:murein DD-endopeptidase MepM/ murein hydrolase activator NlpD